jgi:ketosteroid isomerase-like protein
VTPTEERNLEVVRKGYEAMQRGDIDALLLDCEDDVEFEALISQVEGESFRGHDGLRSFFQNFRQAWDLWMPMPEEFSAEGDLVFVTGTTRVRGKGSGVEMDFPWSQVFRLRDGKVSWAKIYSERDGARRESGLDR